MLTDLSLDTFLDQEFEGRHRAERVLELGGDVVSVLDRSGREDVRLHQPRCANASAVDLQGYVDRTLPAWLRGEAKGQVRSAAGPRSLRHRLTCGG